MIRDLKLHQRDEGMLFGRYAYVEPGTVCRANALRRAQKALLKQYEEKGYLVILENKQAYARYMPLTYLPALFSEEVFHERFAGYYGYACVDVFGSIVYAEPGEYDFKKPEFFTGQTVEITPAMQKVIDHYKNA